MLREKEAQPLARHWARLTRPVSFRDISCGLLIAVFGLGALANDLRAQLSSNAVFEGAASAEMSFKEQWLQQHSSVRPSSYRILANQSNANAYIKAVLEDNGKFTIGTVEGDPQRSSDNDKKLLYGHPNPSTSDTMVRIDGTSYSIHNTTGAVSVLNNTASITLMVDGYLQVEEKLTIVQSPVTRYADTIRIYFKVTNTSTTAHNVSLRTQLDTQLGNNDGAPFRIPSIGEVTTEHEFDNDPATAGIPDIPRSSLVFDNLANPTVIALFTFRDIGYTIPDRVVFGYWPTSVGAWDYTVTGSSFTSDSSVIVWRGYPDAKAVTLASGASFEMAMLYGLGDYTICNVSPFTIGLVSPALLNGTVSGSSYNYGQVAGLSSFTVTGFFNNITASTVTGGQATLNLIPGYQLSPGETRVKPIEFFTGSGGLPSGKTVQMDWSVIAYGRYVGDQKLSVTANANLVSLTCLRDIRINAIPNAVWGQATLEDGTPIAGATVNIYQSGTLVGTATSNADGTYVVSGLTPGEYTVRLTVAGRPDSYFQTYVSATTDAGSSANPISFSAGGDLDTFSYPNPVKQGSAHINYYTSSATGAKIEIFNSAGQLIQTLSSDAPGAGWREALWPIDAVVNGTYFYKVSAGSNSKTGKIAIIKRRGP